MPVRVGQDEPELQSRPRAKPAASSWPVAARAAVYPGHLMYNRRLLIPVFASVRGLFGGGPRGRRRRGMPPLAVAETQARPRASGLCQSPIDAGVSVLGPRVAGGTPNNGPNRQCTVAQLPAAQKWSPVVSTSHRRWAAAAAPPPDPRGLAIQACYGGKATKPLASS